jgi:hypothetical protein
LLAATLSAGFVSALLLLDTLNGDGAVLIDMPDGDQFCGIQEEHRIEQYL